MSHPAMSFLACLIILAILSGWTFTAIGLWLILVYQIARIYAG